MALTVQSTLAVAVLAAVLAVVAAQDPQPQPWPEQWFGMHDRNLTNNDSGEFVAWESHVKWYDWSIRGLRDDCMRNQIGSTFVLFGNPSGIGSDAWLYNVVAQDCVETFSPVGPVTPTWMLGATYLGQTVINETPVNEWVKEDHFYYEGLYTNKIVQQRLPVNNKGESLWETFSTVVFDGFNTTEVFALPSYCRGAPRMKMSDIKTLHQRAELYECFL